MSNRPIVERYLEAISSGDVAAAVACFGPGAEFVGPLGPVPVPEGLRAYLQGFEDAFPRAKMTANNTIEQGDQIAIEGLWTGKHTAPLKTPDGRTIPATNREVRGPFMASFKIRDGKIAVHHIYWDLAAFMAQLA
jgi:steroid delta-isomerase-like uncharacterized protein